jgi:hypothetical protein
MDIQGIGVMDVGWVHLSEDGIQWRTFVNTVMMNVLTTSS